MHLRHHAMTMTEDNGGGRVDCRRRRSRSSTPPPHRPPHKGTHECHESGIPTSGPRTPSRSRTTRVASLDIRLPDEPMDRMVVTAATRVAVRTSRPRPSNVRRWPGARRSVTSSSSPRAVVESPPSPPVVTHDPPRRLRRPIYVSATRQHVGKTTTSLALVSGLVRRLGRDHVGFMKPVGQQTVPVTVEVVAPPPSLPDDDEDSTTYAATTTTTYHVDKDAALIKQYFGYSDHEWPYRDISPVLIPPGYTRDYLRGKYGPPSSSDATPALGDSYHGQIIRQAYDRIVQKTTTPSTTHKEVVLCEGTGHVAVGSIIDACNATVASWLGARMVLVANGGLGRTMDELQLNRAQCLLHGVEIAGVIVNKVQSHKYDQTKTYLTQALQDKWQLPLLGCIPDRPFLGCPALTDLERLFPRSHLVSGKQANRLRHYTVNDLHLVATSLELFLKQLRHATRKRTLYVCHASRHDILLGFLMEAQQRQLHTGDYESALIVTGCDEAPIDTQILEIVTATQAPINYPQLRPAASSPLSSMPFDDYRNDFVSSRSSTTASTISLPPTPSILLVPEPTSVFLEQLQKYTPKFNAEDQHRVSAAIAHYEPYIDFDLLLERTGYFPSTFSENDKTTHDVAMDGSALGRS